MLNKLFGFDSTQTTIRKEIVAGITTFLTMSYILAVNPTMFSILDGMPGGAVFTSTALAAIVGCLAMAFWGKLPFGLAPGMGLNAFFVYSICLGMGYSWQFALTAVLLEGFIFILLTVTNVREAIVNAIPLSLRHAISAGIGLFIAFIGLSSAGVVVNNDATLVALGDITSGSALLALIGLVITGFMFMRNIPGAILIGILVTMIIGIPMGVTEFKGILSRPVVAIEDEDALSGREIEILVEVCRGLSNQEIADKLFISKRTVDKHRANILEKTGCKNTANLVVYAIKNRLVEI